MCFPSKTRCRCPSISFFAFVQPQEDGKVPAKVTNMVVPSGKQTWLLKIAIYG